MNTKRRKQLEEATEVFMKALDEALTCYTDKLNEIRKGEDEAYNNLPEALQASEKGQEIDECLMAIDDVLDELYVDTLLDSLNVSAMLETCGV